MSKLVRCYGNRFDVFFSAEEASLNINGGVPIVLKTFFFIFKGNCSNYGNIMFYVLFKEYSIPICLSPKYHSF